MGVAIVVYSPEELCDLMCNNQLPRRSFNLDDGSNFEACYQTGIYEGYACEVCPHKDECSGYDNDDDEE